MTMEKQYRPVEEFYPYYLTEHQNATCRKLHFVGTGLLFIILIAGLVTGNYIWLISIPFVGYGFAWVGHFFYEKNKPATFKYPFLSLASDFKLFFELLVGRQKFKPQ